MGNGAGENLVPFTKTSISSQNRSEFLPVKQPGGSLPVCPEPCGIIASDAWWEEPPSSSSRSMCALGGDMLDLFLLKHIKWSEQKREG